MLELQVVGVGQKVKTISTERQRRRLLNGLQHQQKERQDGMRRTDGWYLYHESSQNEPMVSRAITVCFHFVFIILSGSGLSAVREACKTLGAH
jgi:hypothetical protein